jgi:hypothetical protein
MSFSNKFKFHISLDEPDANLGVTKKFLKQVKPFITAEVVVGILFITATPMEEFWKMLSDSGISRLLNMNYGNTHNFDEELENYRSFKEHEVTVLENETMNPLTYIEDAFSRCFDNEDETSRKIIFAPGHLYTETIGVGSHTEVVSFFNERGYCVLLMNGKYKGFVYPDNTRVELVDFNAKLGICGELRESLVKWNQLYPFLNLAITGYWVIERGITFNTIGFNFTHMILSNYHLSSINKLIQLSGRATGGKKYVGSINVICTAKVRDTIVEFNDNLERICSLNPENFNRTDFSTAKTMIPIKMVFSDQAVLEKVVTLRKNGKPGRGGYKEQLHAFLVAAVAEGQIALTDRNNRKSFDISNRTLKTVRMYREGHSVDARRFKSIRAAFESYNNYAHSCDSEKQYNIDFVQDAYVLGDFVNDPLTAWITFMEK